jgi:hypothetical protein
MRTTAATFMAVLALSLALVTSTLAQASDDNRACEGGSAAASAQRSATGGAGICSNPGESNGCQNASASGQTHRASTATARTC